MSLSKMKIEELELLSYTDLTELILKESGPKNTALIFKEISKLLSFTDEEYSSKIGDFYTSLTTDKRFIFLEDSAEWDLRVRHTSQIIVADDEDEEEEVIEDEEEEVTEEEEDIDSTISDDDDLDDGDDSISDLTILSEDELDENN